MSAITFEGDENTLVGLLIPFGSPSDRDLDGEYFDRSTDLRLDLIEGDRPLLWHHALDPEVKGEVVGRITGYTIHDSGVWIRAQLDLAGQYAARITELVKAGVVGLSSGALGHLVQRDPDGRIRIWPWIEGSLTVTPAHPRAVAYSVKTAEAARHFAALSRLTPVSRDELREIRHEIMDGRPVHRGLVAPGSVPDGAMVRQPSPVPPSHAPGGRS